MCHCFPTYLKFIWGVFLRCVLLWIMTKAKLFILRFITFISLRTHSVLWSDKGGEKSSLEHNFHSDAWWSEHHTDSHPYPLLGYFSGECPPYQVRPPKSFPYLIMDFLVLSGMFKANFIFRNEPWLKLFQNFALSIVQQHLRLHDA